jgi:hypothetical protein
MTALGALYTAIDRSLGSAEIARAAYGTVWTTERTRYTKHKGPVQVSVDGCVTWHFDIGDRLDSSKVANGWIEIAEEDIPLGKDEFVDLEMPFVKTEEPKLVMDDIK